MFGESGLRAEVVLQAFQLTGFQFAHWILPHNSNQLGSKVAKGLGAHFYQTYSAILFFFPRES
jgi:hypothetical protein